MISWSSAVYARRQNQLQKWTQQRETLSESTRLCSTLAARLFGETNRTQFVCFVPQKQRPKRVKAIYNCVADNPDELTFSEGEVIVVDGEEDQEWWVSISATLSDLPLPVRLTSSGENSSCQRPPAGTRCSAEVTVFSRSLPLRPGLKP